MKLRASPSRLSGRVAIPGSKSHTIRAVAIASLAEGDSTIRAPLDSWDTRSAVACYRALGAHVDTSEPTCWKVTGVAGKPRAPENVIDVGNSGLTLRTALGSAALLPADDGYAVFTGDAQIRRRPVGPLLACLRDLGAFAVSTCGNECVPAVVGGHLSGGTTSIAAVTSQYLSSLLLNAPLADGQTEIIVTQLNEQPFIQMTLDCPRGVSPVPDPRRPALPRLRGEHTGGLLIGHVLSLRRRHRRGRDRADRPGPERFPGRQGRYRLPAGDGSRHPDP